jgi:hypothetical protein
MWDLGRHPAPGRVAGWRGKTVVMAAAAAVATGCGGLAGAAAESSTPTGPAVTTQASAYQVTVVAERGRFPAVVAN